MHEGLGQQVARIVSGQNLTFLNCKQESGKKKLGIALCFATTKLVPNFILLLSKDTPPKPTQTIPPRKDQVLGHLSLWGTFSLKSPQGIRFSSSVWQFSIFGAMCIVSQNSVQPFSATKLWIGNYGELITVS